MKGSLWELYRLGTSMGLAIALVIHSVDPTVYGVFW